MKRTELSSLKEAEQASLNHEILTTWRPGETLGEHMERRASADANSTNGA